MKKLFNEQQKFDYSSYNYRKFDEKTTKAIIECYLQPYGNVGLICKKFKTSKVRVRAMLCDNGIKMKELVDLRKRKKYTLNEHFFKSPELWNNNQAYFFGWIASDGHVNRLHMLLRLAEEDIDILKKLKDLIEYTGPLLLCKESPQLFRNNKMYNCQSTYGLCISSLKLSQSLKDLGLKSNKTFDLEFPMWLNENLLPAFIRGFWEGDGCFSEGKTTYYAGFASACVDFILKLQKILENKLNVTTCIVEICEKETITYSLTINGQYQVIKFLNWIYQDNSIYLNRKYQRYLDLIKQLKYKHKIMNKTKEEIKKCVVFDII